MESIDRWVTGEACLQIARWQEAGATPRVAVNVSGATLRNAESLVELGHIVRRSGVDPRTVEFGGRGGGDRGAGQFRQPAGL